MMLQRTLLLLIILQFCLYLPLWAQNNVVTGKVVDAQSGAPLAGVSVLIKGTTEGTATATDGSFRLNVPPGSGELVFSYIGYTIKEVPVGSGGMTVALTSSNAALNELVVIGYGTQKKKDLTGSVVSITDKDFNKGAITTPEQLISGKVAGVQITSNSGAPGAGSTIRIRGGASLNASNDPLIVIDGVPVDNNGIAGTSSALNLINPNDIASFNILKDASAAAIYGSRASNGVIIITTKSGVGGGKLNVNFNSLQSLSDISGEVDVLSPSEFRQAVNAHGTAPQKALLGNANTDWQHVIYHAAFKTDNNISLSGGIRSLPYRLSFGYLNENGILKTSDFKRMSASLNLHPTFFQDHLSVNLNLKGSLARNRFANQGAIGAAVSFDPTQPVYADNDLGGYFEWLDPATGKPNTLAGKNPLSMLEQERNTSRVNRSIGNLQLDYKFHFLPELRANLNIGYDISEGKGSDSLPATLASVYDTKGRFTRYSQSKTNKLLEFYLNYTKDIQNIHSTIDATAGYSYQDWVREQPAYPVIYGNGTTVSGTPFKTQNTLISYFGRLNYAYKDRYLLTATVRRDGSSRFDKDNRWGVFPSAALAWRISQESFLKDAKAVSDLKIRIGYGVTGQQDVGQDYPYLARYSMGDDGSMYGFGGDFYHLLRPQGYDANIRWEQTETYNAGIDFGFLDGRISGSIDYYIKKTKDLLSTIPVPAGSNLTNQILTNVGNIENKGIELNLNVLAVKSTNFSWNLNFNLTHYDNKITNLTLTRDTTSPGLPVGQISFTGTTIQIHSVGYSPYTYYVYKQLYDAEGKPIEGSYADVNGDNNINEKDLYHYKSPNPTLFLGFSSQFSYKRWTLGFTMRANLGNYMYNAIAANIGTYKSFSYANFLSNVSASVLKTNFENNQYFSDYYIENASFVRMDNINLGYNFGKLFNEKVGLTLSANIQNAFVITGYSGLDPEVPGGIDNNFYPRPRIYSLGLNLDF